MTAAEVLRELRRHGVDVLVADGRLLTRPAGAVPELLQPEIAVHRDELLDLVGRTCPGCGTSDYLPLTAGWRRCWACGIRWGEGADPGDPPDLGALAALLGLAVVHAAPTAPRRGPGWSIGSVLPCPRCGNRVYVIAGADPLRRRCAGPRGCGHIWNPEESRT